MLVLVWYGCWYGHCTGDTGKPNWYGSYVGAGMFLVLVMSLYHHCRGGTCKGAGVGTGIVIVVLMPFWLTNWYGSCSGVEAGRYSLVL